MKEYEIFIENINPCGGEKYAKKDIIEAEAESPEAYVKEHGNLPIQSITQNASGDTIITTQDRDGSVIRYTFTE